jgi:hypothetical protein
VKNVFSRAPLEWRSDAAARRLQVRSRRREEVHEFQIPNLKFQIEEPPPYVGGYESLSCGLVQAITGCCRLLMAIAGYFGYRPSSCCPIRARPEAGAPPICVSAQYSFPTDVSGLYSLKPAYSRLNLKFFYFGPKRQDGECEGRISSLFLKRVSSNMDRRLESRRNPQAGKPALRSADILVCGFWGLSSPQFNCVEMPVKFGSRNPACQTILPVVQIAL